MAGGSCKVATGGLPHPLLRLHCDCRTRHTPQTHINFLKGASQPPTTFSLTGIKDSKVSVCKPASSCTSATRPRRTGRQGSPSNQTVRSFTGGKVRLHETWLQNLKEIGNMSTNRSSQNMMFIFGSIVVQTFFKKKQSKR
jgi:hypothetical protein